MINQRISTAARVTDKTKPKILAALSYIERKLSVNSLGVYMDPREVQDVLALVIGDLEKIRLQLRAAEWPTDHDYDQV